MREKLNYRIGTLLYGVGWEYLQERKSHKHSKLVKCMSFKLFKSYLSNFLETAGFQIY